MDRVSWEQKRGSGGKLDWQATAQERKTETPQPIIYLFTEKLNHGLTEKYSQKKLRTTTVMAAKIDAFSHFTF